MSRVVSTVRNWAAIAILIVFLCSMSYLYWRWLSDYAGDSVHQTLRADLAGSFLRELRDNVGKDGALTQFNFAQTAQRYVELLPEIDCYLLDTNGRIKLFFSHLPGHNDLESVPLEPIKKFLAQPSLPNGPIYAPNPRFRGKPVIFSAAPVSLQGFQGYAFIVLQNNFRRILAIPRFEQGHVYATVLLILTPTIFLISIGFALRTLFRRIFLRIAGVLQSAASDFPVPPAQSRISAKYYENSVVDLVNRLAEERASLQGREKDIKSVISKVSHDVRSPLMLIQDHVERMLEESETAGDDPQRMQLENIIRNLRSLTGMLSDLDVFDLLRRATSPLRLEAGPIDELIYDLHSLYAQHARSREINFAIHAPESLPWVLFDHELLERALRNLLENAFRHTNAGGSVTLGVQVRSERLELEIADTGVGIPHSQISDIFKPFHQVESEKGKDERRNGRSGLGLAIVDQVVRGHGTDLHVESTEGVGTRFWFELKIAQEHREATP